MKNNENPSNGEADEEELGDSGPGERQRTNRKQLPLLAAYGDSTLSIEAAEQLASMAEDATIPAHPGEDLPKADREALLRRARWTRKVP